MPSAVSTSAFASRLGFLVFFFAILNLLYQSVLDGMCQRLGVRLKPSLGDITHRRELIVVHVRARALGKAEQEHRSGPSPVGDQHAIAARAPLSGPRHPLLEDAAAQIRSDQPALRPPHRLAKARIGIRSRRAKRANHFVLKTFTPAPRTMNY